MVAQSTEILAPISQLGWAQACSGVTAAISLSVEERKGPPEAVRISFSTRCGRSSTWKMALCSESIGSRRAPVRLASSRSSGPAQTRLSLLASATRCALPHGGQRRRQAGDADDGGNDAIGRTCRGLNDGRLAGGGFDAGVGKQGFQPSVERRVGNDGDLGARLDRGLCKSFDIGVCGEGDDLELGRTRRAVADHVERRDADRTGGAQN